MEKLIDPVSCRPYPLVHCYVILWHDGWDPFTSKSNRKPIWSLTATVIFVDAPGEHEANVDIVMHFVGFDHLPELFG